MMMTMLMTPMTMLIPTFKSTRIPLSTKMMAIMDAVKMLMMQMSKMSALKMSSMIILIKMIMMMIMCRYCQRHPNMKSIHSSSSFLSSIL